MGNKTPKRNLNDSIFRMLFSEKKELLALFNAVNGTDYEIAEELQINTLDNAVYLSIKNDVSCILGLQMDLYEQQSTVNPNMPLRYLEYVVAQFERMTIGKNHYSGKLIKLPLPRFVVFYNGREAQPESRILRLSDAFMKKGNDLELLVLQLNINKGMNEALKEACKPLREYCIFVDKVREFGEKMPRNVAIEKAIDDCIKQDVLKDFLLKNRAEVLHMRFLEYDEELYRQAIHDDAWEAGMEEGRIAGMKQGVEEGIEKGIERGIEQSSRKIIYHMFKKSQTPEQISDLTGTPIEYVCNLQKDYLQMVKENGTYEV